MSKEKIVEYREDERIEDGVWFYEDIFLTPFDGDRWAVVRFTGKATTRRYADAIVILSERASNVVIGHSPEGRFTRNEFAQGIWTISYKEEGVFKSIRISEITKVSGQSTYINRLWVCNDGYEEEAVNQFGPIEEIVHHPY